MFGTVRDEKAARVGVGEVSLGDDVRDSGKYVYPVG
jgi:hypothetical protein